jgi:hypothetical protein
LKLRSLCYLIHPLLFALFPVVSAFAANLDSTGPYSLVRPSLLSLAGAGILWLLLWIWLRDGLRTSAICSFGLLLFYSYGHLVGADVHRLGGAVAEIPAQGIDRPLILIGWMAVLLGGGWALAKTRSWRAELNRAFSVFAVISLLLPAFRIADFEVRLSRAEVAATPRPCGEGSHFSLPSGMLPDIYYIILDGYGSDQVLLDVYGYDNRSFSSFLVERGFFVARSSRANYVQTRLSLASSLNMTYLDGLTSRKDFELTLAIWIRRGAVRYYLERLGYRTVAFSTGYRTTEIEDADITYTPPGNRDSIIGLEDVLIETSALRLLMRPLSASGGSTLQPGFSAHRDRVEFTLHQLASEVPTLPGPKFVFAHIVSPHPPFVFGPTGAPPSPPLPFTPHDGDFFSGTREEYARGYTDQLTFLNRRVQEVVEAVLLKSPSPPVIILQADHGPGSRLDWSSAEKSDLDERTGILNAYYLPAEIAQHLYPMISPVNSFRLILTHFFGLECPTLPDLSYFSNWTAPLDFQLIDRSVEPASP